METIQETKEKLEKAKKWFEDMTEVDSNLIVFMGISQVELIEAYEREVEGNTK
jgi:hypothetical protein